MKYVSELSMFSLLVLAVYAVLPSTVESRAVETGNYIAREPEEGVADNTGYDRAVDDFIEGYLAGRGVKRASSMNDYVARSSLKRSLRDEMRNEMVKRYRNPLGMEGGSLLGPGLNHGVGRR